MVSSTLTFGNSNSIIAKVILDQMDLLACETCCLLPAVSVNTSSSLSQINSTAAPAGPATTVNKAILSNRPDQETVLRRWM